jgi:hypothetical protein
MANQKIHRYEAAGLSVDAPPTWRSTAASGQFRLKMSDAKTGADKGWLGVSTANWVQLIYGDPNQSNVAICEWIKTRYYMQFMLQINNATVYRWLGNYGGSACWALTGGGYADPVTNYDNTIYLANQSPLTGLVPSSDGWSVEWGLYDILKFDVHPV